MKKVERIVELATEAKKRAVDFAGRVRGLPGPAKVIASFLAGAVVAGTAVLLKGRSQQPAE